MPNQPDPENVMINFRLSRVLRTKLDKLAKKQGVSVTSLITTWIVQGTMNVHLTNEEYEEITEKIKEARKNRK